MNENFYIGQIFDGPYPPAAAAWCGEHNAHLVEINHLTYQIQENDPIPEPTKEEIKQMRVEYRHEHIDDQTLERNRKMANGTWTEEDEEGYLALDAEVTAYIEEHFPYPEEPDYGDEEEDDEEEDA